MGLGSQRQHEEGGGHRGDQFWFAGEVRRRGWGFVLRHRVAFLSGAWQGKKNFTVAGCLQCVVCGNVRSKARAKSRPLGLGMARAWEKGWKLEAFKT